MKNVFVLLYLFLLLSACESYGSIKLSCGSCHDQKKGGNHFKNIANERANAWIWLGDNIYSDFYTMEKRERAYRKITDNLDYQKIMSRMHIWGTWDDHDYAYNNVAGRGWGKDGI